MDSSWYYLRYLCPNATEPLDKQAVAYWMAGGGADQYIGGIEHAVLHLLYARFFTKALRDCGYPVGDEPFKALLCQGMVIGNSYQALNGDYIYPSQVEWRDEGGQRTAWHKSTGEPLKVLPMEKISKSKNNGDSPDALIAKFGADTLRLYMLFTAPPERDLEWSEAAIEGAWRFLNRLWNVAQVVAVEAEAAWQGSPAETAIRRKTHQTIQKITQDIEKFQYNTMVAAGMELLNTLTAAEAVACPAARREGGEALLRLLNPAVPHITEELWGLLGHRQPLYSYAWPQADPIIAADDEITLVVQIDGKVRAKMVVPANISQADALERAKQTEEAQAWLQGRRLVKEIYVPGRLVNFATSA